MLKVKYKRNRLHHCFQALMDNGYNIATDLANSYLLHCSVANYWSKSDTKIRTLNIGFVLCDFLSDAGWHEASERVAEGCLGLLDDGDAAILSINTYIRLLHARTAFCKFDLAEQTFCMIKYLFIDSPVKPPNSDLAELYAEIINFHLARHNYKEAYRWSVDALQILHYCNNVKAAVSILRHSAKACLNKREYKRAKMLIEQAILFCRTYFGDHTPLMAKILLDYGLYLLNIDSVPNSAMVYETSLSIWKSIFGGQNIHVAIAHGDLAYCHYMLEYSSGEFPNAHKHSERAIEMMESLLPPDHLLTASAKRVKALIFEEIAIEITNEELVSNMLHTSHELLLNALQLAKESYGEVNVQTAKYYANLGRLYQSMKRFEDAKDMHLKAISIKEQLLDPDDYEVSLSISHLASLYNYDMNLFREAEALYLRSIEAGLRTFGNCHNGLKYDYSGLIRVYQNLNDEENMNKYIALLNEWMTLRKQKLETESKLPPLKFQLEIIPYDKMLSHFMKLQ